MCRSLSDAIQRVRKESRLRCSFGKESFEDDDAEEGR